MYLNPTKASLAIAAAVAMTFAAPAPSQAQQWDMCKWQSIPDNVLQRLTNRADFEDILAQMFNACPESALALTEAPTATVADGPDSRDTAGDRDNSGDDNDDTPPDSDPETETPGDDGEEGDDRDNEGDDEGDDGGDFDGPIFGIPG